MNFLDYQTVQQKNIHPKYKKTIVDLLYLRDEHLDNKLFGENITELKENECQICGFNEITGELNYKKEIVMYCSDCNPYQCTLELSVFAVRIPTISSMEHLGLTIPFAG